MHTLVANHVKMCSCGLERKALICQNNVYLGKMCYVLAKAQNVKVPKFALKSLKCKCAVQREKEEEKKRALKI